jgi:hypothetical protein
LQAANGFIGALIYQVQRFDQMGFLHDEKSFRRRRVAASSAVDRNVGTHDG